MDYCFNITPRSNDNGTIRVWEEPLATEYIYLRFDALFFE